MATCPLGFGGPESGKDELSPYHCVLCRGLLHDPVVTSGCRHVFCAFCIRRFRDCPVCGVDIESTNPDFDLAATISKILLGHAKLASKSPVSVSAVPPPGVCPAASAANGASTSTRASSCPAAHSVKALSGVGVQGPMLDLPSVLLQLALQSLAGGNPEAALARLDMCADSLCSPPDPVAIKEDFTGGTSTAAAVPAPAAASTVARVSEAAPGANDVVKHAACCAAPAAASAAAAGSGSAGGAIFDGNDTDDPVLQRHLAAAQTESETAARLGAIHGCKADCYRRLGDFAAALRHYSCSLACLAPWRSRSREADSAMSVTYNKLGDMLLLADRLPEAKEHYERALEIRRQTASAIESKVRASRKAAATAAGEICASPDDEVVQDLCDLAVSLCKVADVGFTILQEQQQLPQRQHEQRSTGQPRDHLHEEVTISASAIASPEIQPAATPDEQQQEQTPLTVFAALLTEARDVLLRPELLPYARACGQPAAADAAAAQEAKATGGDLAKERGAAAAAMTGGGGDVTGKSGFSALSPQLATRYGRVCGALEQLRGRLRELEQAGL